MWWTSPTRLNRQNIRHGAFVLGSAHRYFPKNTIHVAVVDPGVGSEAAGSSLSSPMRFSWPGQRPCSHPSSKLDLNAEQVPEQGNDARHDPAEARHRAVSIIPDPRFGGLR